MSRPVSYFLFGLWLGENTQYNGGGVSLNPVDFSGTVLELLISVYRPELK